MRSDYTKLIFTVQTFSVSFSLQISLLLSAGKSVVRVLWDPALSKTNEIQPLTVDDEKYEKN